jgi:hypothetical protein
MLGAKLTSQQRKQIGLWCKENKIGIHGYSKEKLKECSLSGFLSQKQSKSENTFYYWSTIEGRKKRASMGGKASLLSGNNKDFAYWMSPEGIKKRASMGGKKTLGKKSMYKPGDKSFIRVSPEEINDYLQKGYIFGSPISNPNKGKKTNIPSPRRKKVSDGITIYDSLQSAAIINNISSSTITYRCKSKKSKWHYISDNES